ncbi:hypothetical protein [Pseudonocardia sp. D17]|uniref:hypothetical protein n=1 Tax=Pseudonocardia sp. D17 TaxID=882661 RepID=UPI0030D24726
MKEINLDSGTSLLLILVLLFIAVFIWQYVASGNARTTTRVETPRAPQEAAQVVQQAFSGARSALWTATSGPGAFNMRRRGKDGGITMSIDVHALPAGGSAVDMWASDYNQRFVALINFAGSVNSRKKAIARELAS